MPLCSAHYQRIYIMQKSVESIYMNGIKTYCFSSREKLIEYALNEKKSLLAVNAEKILHATPLSRNLFERSIGFSDGVGAVWALRKKGFKEAVKIPGCELWLDIIRHTYTSCSFYLIGSTTEVVTATVEKLRHDFPGIRILNFRDGYIRSGEERQELISNVKVLRPDVVFVAMGSPKQEELIDELLAVHPAVYQGLGGSFDVYTGKVKRAPEWWVRNNLEWAYRLVRQPARIGRQAQLGRFLWELWRGKY